MYSLRIRDHVMIAHSLPDESFGPAQNLHGATYIVDVEFFTKKLTPQNVVIDIARAGRILDEVLEPLRYRNLDTLPELADELTTTEYMARYIFEKLKESVKTFFSGRISITLGESNVAWAGYSDEVNS